ncbi:hypothetical protein K491DRAFT_219556 [Lophiostoma macrostomum CBS 122681]|uniref:Uncharacterized protein n=1 Tax=Lophiostoma macrostomum CBS 122681 TaxID=1314788 RepID=A0A6A6SMX5_9PLEO|nr:hypothetical protein K491DRAFT_219556 [Lophiostoma macrostomum CBS 122681]
MRKIDMVRTTTTVSHFIMKLTLLFVSLLVAVTTASPVNNDLGIESRGDQIDPPLTCYNYCGPMLRDCVNKTKCKNPWEFCRWKICAGLIHGTITCQKCAGWEQCQTPVKEVFFDHQADTQADLDEEAEELSKLSE